MMNRVRRIATSAEVRRTQAIPELNPVAAGTGYPHFGEAFRLIMTFLRDRILLTTHNRMVMFSLVKAVSPDPVFRALADPTRRAIFQQLARQGELTVHVLTSAAGVSQPAVSKHLSVLKRAKLVRHRREGRETHYRAQPEALEPMVNWLRDYGAFWRDRFDALETLLERMEG